VGPDGFSRPIAFASRVLSTSERNYPSNKAECLGALWACTHFRPYVHGTLFVLITDHEALLSMLDKITVNTPTLIQRWALQMQELRYIPLHRAGISIPQVDGLSRLASLARCTESSPLTFDDATVIDRSSELEHVLDTLSRTLIASCPRPALTSNVIHTLGAVTRSRTVASRSATTPPVEVPVPTAVSSSEVFVPPPVSAAQPSPVPSDTLSQSFSSASNIAFLERVRLAQLTDEYCGPMIQHLIASVSSTLGDPVFTTSLIARARREFISENGVLCVPPNKDPVGVATGLAEKRVRLIVPLALVPIVLLACHDSRFAGHQGQSRTLARVQARFWWPDYRHDVIAWVRQCALCDSVKQHPNSHQYPGQPIPLPLSPFKTWGMDCYGPLPETPDGFASIIVFTEYHSRWAEVIPLKTISAEAVARAFVDFIVLRFGTPDVLISDQGSDFTSHLFAAVVAILGTDHHFTTSFRQNSNGLTERFNQVLAASLAIFTASQSTSWVAELPFVAFAHRSIVSANLGVSPFRMLFGVEPRMPIDVSLDSAPTDYALLRSHIPLHSQDSRSYLESFERGLSVLRTTAHDHLLRNRARSESAKAAGRSRSPLIFEPGQLVRLKRQAYRTGARGSRKLEFVWLGPYVVIKNEGLGNFRIGGRSGASAVVHGDMLKVSHLPGDLLTSPAAPQPCPSPGGVRIDSLAGRNLRRPVRSRSSPSHARVDDAGRALWPDGQHNDVCEVCDNTAHQSDLLCCDYCNLVWHPQCLNLTGIPTTQYWMCSECTKEYMPATAALSASVNFVDAFNRSVHVSDALLSGSILDVATRHDPISRSRCLQFFVVRSNPSGHLSSGVWVPRSAVSSVEIDDYLRNHPHQSDFIFGLSSLKAATPRSTYENSLTTNIFALLPLAYDAVISLSAPSSTQHVSTRLYPPATFVGSLQLLG
jgi:transposase InsO family protein